MLASLGRADVETLLARAANRLAHGNEEGARALYLRALAEDPACGKALAYLASKEGLRGEIALPLRYLTDAKPLDADTAARLLGELGDRGVDPPDGLLHEAERAAISAAEETCGPWRPWQAAVTAPPTVQAAGPLRTEALSAASHPCREALLRVADRLERERIESPCVWALLAVCLHAVGEQPAAEAALSRASPTTLDDRTEVARCALLVAPDPATWWAAHGEALLSEIVRAEAPAELRAGVESVLDSAYVLHADARDLRGAASLAAAFARCRPPGEGSYGFDRLARLISVDWPADEAYAALADDRSSAARCLCGALLSHMHQYDRALEVFEALVRDDPDDLLARDCLVNQMTPGSPEHARAALAMEELASRKGLRLGTRASWCCLEATCLLEGESARTERLRRLLREQPEWLRGWRLDPRISKQLLEDFLDAARRLAAQPKGLEEYAVADLLHILLEAHRTEDALRLLETTSCAVLHGLLAGHKGQFRWEEDYAEMRPLLALVASHAHLGEGVDSFLRLFPRIEPSKQVPFVVWRLRESLEGDAAFRRLPAADYVLSCLHDPVIDQELVLALRRSACRAGCRSRALLVDLIRAGDPLLEELASVDPVAARLERALQASGPEGLEAFLETDDMTEEEFLEARRRRSGTKPNDDEKSDRASAFGRFTQDARRDDLADPQRIVWEVLQESPPYCWMLDSLAGQAGLLPPAIAAELQKWKARREPPGEAFFRTLPSAAGLARSRPSYWGNWDEAIAHVAESEGKAGVGTLLSGPYGSSIADRLRGRTSVVSAEDLADLLRTEGRAHPLDLGWLWLEECTSREKPADDPRRREIALAYLAAAQRSPSRMASTIQSCDGVEQKDDLAHRVLALFEGLPPARVIPIVQGWVGHPVDPRLGEVVLEWAASRCTTVEDNLALCDFQERVRRNAEADRLEEALMRDGSLSTRLRVIGIRWSWQRPPMAVETLRSVAEGGGGTTSQTREVWIAVCKAAAHEENLEAFTEAITAIWRDAPIEWRGGLSGSACALHWNNPAVGKIVSRLLAKGDAPLPLQHFALGLLGEPADLDQIQEAKRRLAEAGFSPPAAWLDAVARLPRAQMLERLRAAIPQMQDLEGRDREIVTYVCSRLRSDGRTEDLLACADLWATTQTPPDARAWGPPPERRDWRFRIGRRPTPAPLIGGFPRPPAGEHLLPASAWAAEFLVALGMLDAAGEKAGQAAEEASDAVSREACRLMQARLFAAGERPAEAMRILLELRDHSTTDWLREEAGTQSSLLFSKDLSARAEYVDLFLREHASSVRAAEEEVRAWDTRLRSDDEVERRRATEELRARGEGALGILRELRSSDDPEVRARIEELLEDLLAP